MTKPVADGSLRPATSHVVATVKDLSVTLSTPSGDVHAIRGISLEVVRGEIVAIVGESGSGKTMFALSLLGLLPQSPAPRITGSVVVAGVDMLGGEGRQERDARRHWLGAVFQDPLTSLNPTMRIGDQLLERGISRQAALSNLQEAGVTEPERRFRQFPHELSGGLRQRTMIAMAIGVQPDEDAKAVETATGVVTDDRGTPRLIIADEPTTALDVSVQAQVVLLFDRIRRDVGCSVIFVTHDLGVAASIADRIAVFYAGRIREVGPAADVLKRPRHPYTRDLLNARLSIDEVGATSITGDPPDPRTAHSGCAYYPRCTSAQNDCASEHPPLTPRNPGTNVGLVACFHPVTTLGSVTARLLRKAPGGAATTSAAPVLELRNVSKTFLIREGTFGRRHRELHAVDDVSLTIPEGGSVALVGESGCGKTTTLRIATGLTKPDSGSVGRPASVGRPELVFQDAGSSLTPWLRVGTQIEERLKKRGVPPSQRAARITEVLSLVGLDARAAAAKPRDLSGGQRQRAAIARALASEPSLLICDEPVSALDASLVIRVLELLESLRERLGVALLVVTHDLAVARRIAFDVAVMYRGRIVEQGPVGELFSNPAHPYTQGLIAAIPTTEPGRLAPTLAGEPPAATGRLPGCSFASRCAYVRDRCETEAPPLYEVSPTRVSACHFYPEVLHLDKEQVLTEGVSDALCRHDRKGVSCLRRPRPRATS
jgi:peptide/nickel transport system ATP-binding protein